MMFKYALLMVIVCMGGTAIGIAVGWIAVRPKAQR